MAMGGGNRMMLDRRPKINIEIGGVQAGVGRMVQQLLLIAMALLGMDDGIMTLGGARAVVRCKRQITNGPRVVNQMWLAKQTLQALQMGSVAKYLEKNTSFGRRA